MSLYEFILLTQIMSHIRMAQSIGGLARLTWGWRESGHGRRAEKSWRTLSGSTMNQTVELVGTA